MRKSCGKNLPVQQEKRGSIDWCEGQFLSHIFLVPKKTALFILCSFSKGSMRSSGTNISKRRVLHADEPVSAGGLDVYDRPQRHLFLHAHISGGPKVPPVSVAESVVPVPGSSIRVVAVPRAFTKLLRPVIGLLRRLGFRLLIYLDDIILLNQLRGQQEQERDSTLWLLQSTGTSQTCHHLNRRSIWDFR